MGRRAPDVTVAPGQNVEPAPQPPRNRRAPDMVGRVHDESERRLERLRHLDIVERQFAERERFGDDADHRRDTKPRSRPAVVEPPDHIDARPREPDLLLGLAQGGVHRVAVAGVDPPAGEGDLPGMRVEALGAPGQQHRHAVRPVDQGHQDRCVPRRTRRSRRRGAPRTPGKARREPRARHAVIPGEGLRRHRCDTAGEPITRVVVGFAARRRIVVEARSVAPGSQVDIAVPVVIAMTVARRPAGPRGSTNGAPFRMPGPPEAVRPA